MPAKLAAPHRPPPAALTVLALTPWRREEVVRRFMVERGAELNRFSFIGFGEDLARGNAPPTRGQERHVMVRVFRPVD